MPFWGQIAAAVAPQILGGLMGGASSAGGYGQASAEMKAAGDKSFKEGQYKPYGVTTGLGSSQFNNGQASFSLDPRYQQSQGQMQGLGQQAYSAASGDYNQLANQFYNQQRDMGAGSRQAEAMKLGESMFGTGSTNLRMGAESLGATGGGMLSPQGYGFAQAFAQQDSLDRFNAQNQAQLQRQREIDIGNSMFNQSMSLDTAGLNQVELGGMFGQQQSAANNMAMSNYLKGYGVGAESDIGRGNVIGGTMAGIGKGIGAGLGDWRNQNKENKFFGGTPMYSGKTRNNDWTNY